jgi:aryl-alcohol dehydrogenase-like predicted oxidoreductase
MKNRILGKTGLEVSELSMGGLFVASFAGDFERAKAAVYRALDLGVNYIDTAPGYADSEEVLGKILDGVSIPFILSTKFGGRPQPFNAQDKKGLMTSLQESLRLLKRETIDILIIHEPDRPGQYDWWTDYESVQGPVLEVLDELKQKGIIRFTGLGGTTAYEIAPLINSNQFDVVLTAFNYSLLWREAEHEVIPAAIRNHYGIIIGSPLQQGALSQRFDAEITRKPTWLSKPRQKQYQALYKYIDEIGIPLTELALRFVISNQNISTTLMGARSPKEVEQNVAAVEKGPLPTDVLSRLDEIAAMVPFRPFEEPFGLPFGRNYKGPGMAGR